MNMLIACCVALIALAACPLGTVHGGDVLKTVVLVGPSDAGKESVANALINRGRGSQDPIFLTRNETVKKYCSAYIDERQLLLVDTFGLGDPRVDQSFAYGVFEQTMSLINYGVDLVIVVLKSGEMSDELASYFRLFYERVLVGGGSKAPTPNLLLVCNECQKDWVESVMVIKSNEDSPFFVFSMCFCFLYSFELFILKKN